MVNKNRVTKKKSARSSDGAPQAGSSHSHGFQSSSLHVDPVEKASYGDSIHSSIPMQYQRPKKTSSVPCRYFLRGFCRYGDSCRFQHSEADVASVKPRFSFPSMPTAKPSSKKCPAPEDCIDWHLTGSCPRGRACRYAHPPQSGLEGFQREMRHRGGMGSGGLGFMAERFLREGFGGNGFRGDDTDVMEQRQRNGGFTDDDVYELSLQGIKPWDPEAWDALAVLNGWDMDDGYGDEDYDDDDEFGQRMRNFGVTDDDAYELSLQGIKPWDPEASAALDVLYGRF